MASTRNKNDRGNYGLEELAREEQRIYLSYKNQGNGQAYLSNFAGDGLLMGQMGPSVLSYNAIDIESQLKGIGSTNLVTPLPEVEPHFKTLEHLSIMDKTPLLLPKQMTIEKNQRPLLR